MQTRNKFLDDMSQLMTNAMGVAQGARTEAETLLRKCSGCHLISAAFLIAMAANFGVVMLKNVSAPEACRRVICESIVGSVTS